MIKTLHHVWLGSSLPSEYEELRDEAIHLNPAFEFVLWTEPELEEAFGADYTRVCREITGLSKRSNVFRMMILKRFGGVYMDLDFKHVKPLPEFSGCVLGDSEDFGVQGAFIYAEPNHPALTVWLSDPRISSLSEPIERGMGYLEGVEVLPPQYFYSHRFEDKGKPVGEFTGEVIAAHLWNGYWRRESNVVKTIPFVDIPVFVTSLNSNHKRREDLNLPFDYTVNLQEPVEGINASKIALGRLGNQHGLEKAVRHAKSRDYPAFLLLEDDAVWIGDNVEQICCRHPIEFLGGESILGRTVERDGVFYGVARSTAVLFRRDSYDAVLAVSPSLEDLRLKSKRMPVGATPADLIVSSLGVHLSPTKLFKHSGASSSIGHDELKTKDNLYAT